VPALKRTRSLLYTMNVCSMNVIWRAYYIHHVFLHELVKCSLYAHFRISGKYEISDFWNFRSMKFYRMHACDFNHKRYGNCFILPFNSWKSTTLLFKSLELARFANVSKRSILYSPRLHLYNKNHSENSNIGKY